MSEIINLAFQGSDFPAYLAKPTGMVKGGIIVIHEVWGLDDHIKSVADRFAREGYIALVPDLLSETEIAEHAQRLQADLFDPEKRNEAQPKLRALMAPFQEPAFADTTNDKLALCFNYLYEMPLCDENVAVIGFCFGGSYSYSLAIRQPLLKAAIPFYGHTTTDVEELKCIVCPVRAFYGEDDERLITSLPEVIAAMKTAQVDYEAKVYPDAGHAFFNDSNPRAYNEAAATDAWQRTLTLLSETM